MLKIRRPLGRLIFNMGIAIPGKTVFLIETAPWSLANTWHISFHLSYWTGTSRWNRLYNSALVKSYVIQILKGMLNMIVFRRGLCIGSVLCCDLLWCNDNRSYTIYFLVTSLVHGFIQLKMNLSKVDNITKQYKTLCRLYGIYYINTVLDMICRDLCYSNQYSKLPSTPSQINTARLKMFMR